MREGAGDGSQQMEQEVAATRRRTREGAGVGHQAVWKEGAGAGHQAAHEGKSRAPEVREEESRTPAARKGGSRRWQHGGQA
jgi:hypothetical protein